MTTALDLLSALVIEDGRRWGEAAVPVQWADATAVLDEDPDAPPYHWLGRSRGFSKTSDLAGVACAVLLAQAPGRARLFGVAADQAQSQLLIDAIAGYASRTPELQSALTVSAFTVSANRSGARLEVLPADGASIWGRRPFFVIVDELAQWHSTSKSHRVWEGITTGLAKVRGSRMAVLTTAGDPSHFSYRIRDAALSDPLWRVNDVHGPAPWLDPARIEAERRRLPESSFARLFLNQWTSGEDRLADQESLMACVQPDAAHETPKAATRYVIGLDVGVKKDRTVATIAHAERVPGQELPRVVVDRMQVWTPGKLRPVRLADVESWIREFSKRYNRATVVADPSQALGLLQGLKRSGVITREHVFAPSSNAKLANTLLRLIRDGLLALPDDPELLDELANVRLESTSLGTVRLVHDRSRHDDRIAAVGICAVHLTGKAQAARPARGSSALLGANSRRSALGSGMRDPGISGARDGRSPGLIRSNGGR